MPPESSHLPHIRAYLQAIATGATGEALAKFYTPDALQSELPNRLNPNGGTSDLATLLARAEQGQKLLKGQRYDIQSELAQGDQVAVEAKWSAELAVPVGTLAAGATMKAHFAMFFEMREGRIHRQRNYDCFEPW